MAITIGIVLSTPAEIHDEATLLERRQFAHDIVSFSNCYPGNCRGDSMELYKVVDPQTGCDFFTGQIKYEGIVECPDWDDDPNRQCGGGLHLSPTPELALSYNTGKIKKFLVKTADIVVYPYDISKVRCRVVTEVIE